MKTYAVSDHINQLILEHLDPNAWHAKPPGRNARTIAAILAQVHNIRRKWLRLSAPHLKLPAQLDRTRCTQRQASAALAESAGLSSEMLAEAFASPDGSVKQFRRDGWARPWPGGAASLPTCSRMKPIIAAKYACWRISWVPVADQGRLRNLVLGKTLEEVWLYPSAPIIPHSRNSQSHAYVMMRVSPILRKAETQCISW